MKRPGRLVPGIPRRVSRKRRRLAKVRQRVLEHVADRDVRCVAHDVVPTVGCRGPLDGHELTPRGRGGSPYDPTNVVLVCRAHHHWIGNHPAEATALGLLRKACS